MITAGIHGDELNGVLAAQQIIRDLFGKGPNRTVTVVPTVESISFTESRQPRLPSSLPQLGSCPANLNHRLFPGDPWLGSQAALLLLYGGVYSSTMLLSPSFMPSNS
ncbi:succinylglutamate desuccinylase/aspartoacylase family protein [Vibrio chagasii]|nr:succinylglutamate desuccinylase/aspartoacylase family protein [Vibrio chagasii]